MKLQSYRMCISIYCCGQFNICHLRFEWIRNSGNAIDATRRDTLQWKSDKEYCLCAVKIRSKCNQKWKPLFRAVSHSRSLCVCVCVCVIAISYVYWWHMIYCHLLFNFRDRPFMLPYFDLFYKFTWKWTHKSQLNIFGIENHIWFKWKQYFTWKSHYPLIHIGLYICFSCAVGRFGLALIHLIIIGFIYTVICNNGELRRSNFCRAELHTARHEALA